MAEIRIFHKGYIGLCYGRFDVGKTHSARSYSAWDQLQSFDANAASAASVEPPHACNCRIKVAMSK
jgi:hypothetical protein